MTEKTPILVAIERGNAIAGVVRDIDGVPCLGLWQRGEEPRPLTLIKSWLPVQVASGAAMAIGAIAPPGARAFEARADSGSWSSGRVAAGFAVALVTRGDLRDDLPPYRFLDALGELVPARPPGPLTALVGAPLGRARPDLVRAVCPACAAATWGVVSDRVAGGERLVCANCGYTSGGLPGVYLGP